MQSLLADIVTSNIYAFLLIFARFGAAVLIMPGIGDSFVSPNIRLYFALGFSFVLTPFLTPLLPPMPTAALPLGFLIMTELVTGIFIGTVMRIMIGALDTAGSVISIQTGFANAMLFNPVSSSQGSLVGALYSMMGVTLMLVADLHHQMIAAIVESYAMFAADSAIPDAGSMGQVITSMVSLSFKTGVQIAIPFLIVGLIMQAGFGILGRLMPQLQIFFLALPAQILLCLIILSATISAGAMFWLAQYNDVIVSSFLE
ncbi:MAG: flagellar biosynthetic protein FliR [Alphaproteobacteria bacterium]|nr:flagellar biosynthetic protein FliR [Alphaproteobacteria bacterium]